MLIDLSVAKQGLDQTGGFLFLLFRPRPLILLEVVTKDQASPGALDKRSLECAFRCVLAVPQHL